MSSWKRIPEQPIVARSAADIQRMRLGRLMRNPNKPIIIPEKPKERGAPIVPDFVRNVMGSSAGAGSGEFHVYRHLRRKEYARQHYMSEKARWETLEEEYHQKVEENKRKAEEETAKKRAKRLKKKRNKKQRGKVKNEVTKSSSDESEPNDTEEEENKEDSNKIEVEGCIEEPHDNEQKIFVEENNKCEVYTEKTEKSNNQNEDNKEYVPELNPQGENKVSGKEESNPNSHCDKDSEKLNVDNSTA